MSGKQTREERLAEKLRENLRRRKTQSKAQSNAASRASAIREGTETESPLPNDDAGR